MTSRAVQIPIMDKKKTSGGPCVCGCGEFATKYFIRGHQSRWNNNLRMIREGEGTPIQILGRSLAMRLGPWELSDEGGHKPSKTYKDLR